METALTPQNYEAPGNKNHGIGKKWSGDDYVGSQKPHHTRFEAAVDSCFPVLEIPKIEDSPVFGIYIKSTMREV